MKTIFTMLLLFASVSFAQVMGAKLAVQSPAFNFGDIKPNSFVEHDFVISNTGDDSLVIMDVRASCGCTAAQPEKNVLLPGESAKINVKFNTIGRVGKQQKYVYIISNDKENPETRLSFTANVLPDTLKGGPVLQLSEFKHDFGVMEEGKIADWKVDFKNAGNSELEIRDIKTSCGCTAATVSGRRLKPGEAVSLRIEFDSTSKQGKLSRTVTLYTNDYKQPEQTLVIYAEVKDRK
ncbi:MAG: DUF1573 domain-containing protein [Ignavibacteria bacterium]|jgi:hypothetical protein|nr:DUF1573 domain-containing protein [Ignavibacteria bacterium]MCU7503130.1 DUF1573 domain-containing protein [Ignavibacteria bacterium]MCU7518232.1 DUF1573 domain-containing protein [Ignavibacteria bacterium]